MPRKKSVLADLRQLNGDYSKPLNPVHQGYLTKNVRQLVLYELGEEPGYNDYGKRALIGTYYERLTQTVFGGVRHARMYIPYESMRVILEPDVTDTKTNTHRESKGVLACGGYLKLDDPQVLKYFLKQMIITSEKIPVIFLNIYLHNCPGICKSRISHQERRKMLAENTVAMIQIPFSVFWAIHQEGVESGVRRSKWQRKDEKGIVIEETPMIRFKPIQLVELMEEPERVMARYLPDIMNYSIRRKRVPSGMYMYGFPVSPFPVLLINHKDLGYHRRWFEDFQLTYKEELEEIIEQERQKKMRGEPTNLIEFIDQEQAQAAQEIEHSTKQTPNPAEQPLPTEQTLVESTQETAEEVEVTGDEAPF